MEIDNEFQRIKNMVQGELNFNTLQEEEEVKNLIASMVYREVDKKGYSLRDKENLVKKVFDSVRKLDILQELIEDDEISEIMVNGYDRIFIEKNGEMIESNKHFESGEKFEDVLQQIVSSCNRSVNEREPIVDARLSGGERVSIVLNPPAVNGPILNIRRFPKRVFTMEKLIENKSISAEAALFLKDCVTAGYNCFVSGSTSSGKTTLLNVLSEFIPSNERVITIEDSAELQIKSIDNLVSLETRNANSSGCEAITIRDLLRCALRMRPDRLIVGEVRGPEVADMLQIFNTGHEGSLSTAHANSSKDMLTRLEAMYLQSCEIPLEAIRRQIASGIDIMIHLERCRDGKRRVSEINEVLWDKGGIALNRIYELRDTSDGFSLVHVGDLVNTSKIERQRRKVR